MIWVVFVHSVVSMTAKRIRGRGKKEKDEWWEELPLDTKRRIEKRVGPPNNYPICSYRSKQSFAVKTWRCNLRPAKSRRIREFWKAYCTDEEKAWSSPEKPSASVPDSAECHALMEDLTYVLFAFSDLNFQQISSKWTIHHYLCWLKECFPTLN